MCAGACRSPNHARLRSHAGEQKTTIGAGTGAVVGAGLGYAIGGGRGAAIGAVVGGLAGGVIGHYMDKQEREFKQALAESQAREQQQSCRGFRGKRTRLS